MKIQYIRIQVAYVKNNIIFTKDFNKDTDNLKSIDVLDKLVQLYNEAYNLIRDLTK